MRGADSASSSSSAIRRRRWALPVLGAAAVLSLLALAACSPLKLIDRATPEAGYRLVADQAYGAHPRQRLDVYVPTATPGPWPVMVFFYGGSWREGDKRDYRFVGQALAERGVLVVMPDYRLYPDVRWQGVLEDSAAATAWAFAQAARLGGDAQRVFVAGHSAGAWNAAMLALDARWLRGAGHHPGELAGFAGLAGPYNFLPIVNPRVKPVFDWPDTPADSQPLHHVGSTARHPPVLLVAPHRDSLVDPEDNSATLAAALRGVGAQVAFKQYAMLGHVTTVGALSRPLRPLAPVLDDLADFTGVRAIK